MSQNVVFDNYYGIEGSGTRSYNRVYNNATYGIFFAGTTATGNVVYSNKTGIYVPSPGATLANNLVYANIEQGIVVRSSGLLINNTVYQTAGDAVNVGTQVSNLQLRNNILWVTATTPIIPGTPGYDIFVPANSQVGFQSDYNLLYTSDNGLVGNWQGAARSTLTAWQNATFTDQNSLSQNPLFVDVDGATMCSAMRAPRATAATTISTCRAIRQLPRRLAGAGGQRGHRFAAVAAWHAS